MARSANDQLGGGNGKAVQKGNTKIAKLLHDSCHGSN